jgi:hypothetical protein
LLDHQADHPDGFVVGVADFLEDGVERFFFADELDFEEFFAARDLFLEDAVARLPGESDPGEKSGTVALRRPVVAFEGVGEGLAALRCGFEYAALGARGGLAGVAGAKHSRGDQFFQRIVDLGARNCGPVADAAALEFEIDLIAVHGAFNEQTEDHQIGSRDHRAELLYFHPRTLHFQLERNLNPRVLDTGHRLDYLSLV